MTVTSVPSSQPRQLPLTALIGAGFVAQVLSIYPLWSQDTNGGEFLGHYGESNEIVLAANMLLLLVWLVLFLRRKQTVIRLNRLSFVHRFRTIAFSAIALAVLWLLPFETVLKEYASLNWLLLTACLMYASPDREIKRSWNWVPWLIIVLLFIPIIATVLTDQSSTTSESQWADYATSPFEASGLYARTQLQDPIVITPGVGWSVAGYGWLLENSGFDIKIGRLWNFYFYLLAFIGIAAVTWRLYGRRAAVISVIFAVFSQAFIPFADYRPDHQLPAAAMLITFAAIQARYSENYRGFWDFICGLAATLALQLHAAAIVFAFGFALFYLTEVVLASYQARRLVTIRPLLWFGLGAFIGTLLYFVFNIQPIGGLETYLQAMTALYGSATRSFSFLTWPSLLEGMIILASLAYIAWRRTRPDRLFLGILACMIVAILLFDPIGYTSTFDALYVIPVGVLVADPLVSSAFHERKSLHAVTLKLGLVAILTAQVVTVFVAWARIQQMVETANLTPFIYEDLKPRVLPYLKDSDVVVSVPEFLWTSPRKPQVIAFDSEQAAMKRWNMTDPEQVWERVKPTAIVYIENRMTFEQGLKDYLDKYHFIVCKEINTQNSVTIATVYRQTCPSSSGS